MDTNITTDGRSLSDEALTAIRIKAVDLHIKHNMSMLKISQLLHMAYTAIHSWVQLYKKYGYEGLKVKQRGRKKEIHRRIKSDTMDKIVNIIKTKLPEDYDLPGIHWTSKIIVQLIKDKFDISIGRRGVLYYLKEKRLSFLKDMPKE